MNVPVDCPECHEPFEVPKSLRGGITNCPRCQKAVSVKGGPEPLFIAIVALFSVVAVMICLAAFAAGPLVGGIATAAIVLAGIVTLICM